MKTIQILFFGMLLFAFPALRAQDIDYLAKAKEFLEQGDCERARLAYEDYKKYVNPQGNAEVWSRIQECGKCPSIVKDFDGNTYHTVQIGNQCWMKENLRTTHYADGTYIARGSNESYTTGYWYYPADNSANKSTCGLLYNWKAVMRNASSSSSNPSRMQGICPRGWHVPSDAEWTQLTDYVGSQSQYRCGNSEDNIAKSLASQTGWNSSSSQCDVGNTPSDNNATGFSALPAGCYYKGYYGDFGGYADFWSATEDSESRAWCRSLDYYDANVYRGYSNKISYFSVRCLRD